MEHYPRCLHGWSTITIPCWLPDIGTLPKNFIKVWRAYMVSTHKCKTHPLHCIIYILHWHKMFKGHLYSWLYYIFSSEFHILIIYQDVWCDPTPASIQWYTVTFLIPVFIHVPKLPFNYESKIYIRLWRLITNNCSSHVKLLYWLAILFNLWTRKHTASII